MKVEKPRSRHSEKTHSSLPGNHHCHHRNVFSCQIFAYFGRTARFVLKLEQKPKLEVEHHNDEYHDRKDNQPGVLEGVFSSSLLFELLSFLAAGVTAFLGLAFGAAERQNEKSIQNTQGGTKKVSIQIPIGGNLQSDSSSLLLSSESTSMAVALAGAALAGVALFWPGLNADLAAGSSELSSESDEDSSAFAGVFAAGLAAGLAGTFCTPFLGSSESDSLSSLDDSFAAGAAAGFTPPFTADAFVGTENKNPTLISQLVISTYKASTTAVRPEFSLNFQDCKVEVWRDTQATNLLPKFILTTLKIAVSLEHFLFSI